MGNVLKIVFVIGIVLIGLGSVVIQEVDAKAAAARTYGEVISVDAERSQVTVRDIDMNVQKTFNLGRCDFAGLKKGVKVEINSQAGSVWADSIKVKRSGK